VEAIIILLRSVGPLSILLMCTWSLWVIHRTLEVWSTLCLSSVGDWSYGSHPWISGTEQHQDSSKWRGRLHRHRQHARGICFQWYFWRSQIGFIALVFKFEKYSL
jgi:hypothetical protein